jgi:aminopeptidase N
MSSLTLRLFNRKYGSATPDDLFAALQKAADESGIWQGSNLNVPNIMKSWTTQAGYPLITASRISEGDIHLTQVCQMLNTAAFTKGTYNDYNRMI